MNIDNIFSLFKPESKTIKKWSIDNVSMFKDLVHNNPLDKKFTQLLSHIDDELNQYDVQKAGDWIKFSSGWEAIKNINIKYKKHQKLLKNNLDVELYEGLLMSKKYFESIEEYEKCKFLTDIQKFLKIF